MSLLYEEVFRQSSKLKAQKFHPPCEEHTKLIIIAASPIYSDQIFKYKPRHMPGVTDEDIPWSNMENSRQETWSKSPCDRCRFCPGHSCVWNIVLQKASWEKVEKNEPYLFMLFAKTCWNLLFSFLPNFATQGFSNPKMLLLYFPFFLILPQLLHNLNTLSA